MKSQNQSKLYFSSSSKSTDSAVSSHLFHILLDIEAELVKGLCCDSTPAVDDPSRRLAVLLYKKNTKVESNRLPLVKRLLYYVPTVE